MVDFVRACGGSPGDVVRQQVADKREHEYLQRGIACYLFALDDQQIIDSSMKGNSARFINHCCDVRPRIPSGYQRVLLAGLHAFEYDVCTCQIYFVSLLAVCGGCAAELHSTRYEPGRREAHHLQHAAGDSPGGGVHIRLQVCPGQRPGEAPHDSVQLWGGDLSQMAELEGAAGDDCCCVQMNDLPIESIYCAEYTRT